MAAQQNGALAPVHITPDLSIEPIDYRGQRVLTLAQVDRVHGRPDGTARRNFANHKAKLFSGEDYFYVTDSQGLNEIRSSAPGVLKPAANEITLLTETGYLMLVKSFTDDLAWQVQRQLVKHYFRTAAPAGPDEAPIDHNDMQNLQRAVWSITDRFGDHKTAWRQAVWYALRKATQCKAPDPFRLRHLPVLAGELQRLMRISVAVRQHFDQIETYALRRIVRGGEPLAQLEAQLAQQAVLWQADEARWMPMLSRWQQQDMDHVAQRWQPRPGDGRSDHSDCAEPRR